MMKESYLCYACDCEIAGETRYENCPCCGSSPPHLKMSEPQELDEKDFIGIEASRHL